ncbi:MAG TPA: hypothetical protein VLT17_09960 [Gemmatimonadales bacterium]|nr:hypothetical protein [Gemmatimonadales bacterium]
MSSTLTLLGDGALRRVDETGTLGFEANWCRAGAGAVEERGVDCREGNPSPHHDGEEK